MKIREGFTLRKVGNEQIVVPVGNASFYLNGLIKLNEAGVLLWNELLVGSDENALAEKLVEKYGIGMDVAAKDVSVFLKSLQTAKCLEE